MIKQKPAFEAIEPNFGHSYTYQKFDASRKNNDNIWHYHSEIELVYINGGAGKRRIGSPISGYIEGDLILIESNFHNVVTPINLQATKVGLLCK